MDNDEFIKIQSDGPVQDLLPKDNKDNSLEKIRLNKN